MNNRLAISSFIPQYNSNDKQKGPGQTDVEIRLNPRQNQKGYGVVLNLQATINNKIKNRERMRKLCGLAGSYSDAAQLISEQAIRPCSKESIKAWTCNPATTRARTCHDWAVNALEARLKFLGKIS